MVGEIGGWTGILFGLRYKLKEGEGSREGNLLLSEQNAKNAS